MALPPLPPGFVVEPQAQRRRDPWEVFQEHGFTATNGYRTAQDTARIRAQGYRPSATSLHNEGSGVDLNHPRLSRAEQEALVRRLAAENGWDGAEILNEGHHIHFGLPGWRAAPGTPGTPNSGLPALPEGYDLEQRGSLLGSNFVQAQRGASAPAAAADVPAPQPRASAPVPEPIARAATARSVDVAAASELQGLLDAGAPHATILEKARSLNIPVTPDFAAGVQNAVRWRDTNRRRGARIVPATVASEPAAEAPPLPTRLGAAAGRGVANILGAPVDAANALLNVVGVPTSPEPFLGSGSWKDIFGVAGLPLTGERFDFDASTLAPQSTAERYAQRGVQFIGENLVPALGLIGGGSRLLAKGAGALSLNQGNAVSQAGRTFAVEAARAPGLTVAGDIGGSLGAAFLGEAAADAFPGSTAAEIAGQTIGGLAGGLGVGAMVARLGRTPVDSIIMSGGGPRTADRMAVVDQTASALADDAVPLPPLSQAIQQREPVRSNVPPDAVSDFVISPVEVAERGPAGYSIEGDDDVRTVVFRDQQGVARGGVRIPLSEEARAIYDQITTYVEPEFRRQGVATGLYEHAMRNGIDIDARSGTGDLTPDGAAFVNAVRTRATSTGGAAGPGLASPAPRVVDRIDVEDLPPLPPGFLLEDPLGRVLPQGPRPSSEDLADVARSISPGDVIPIPQNRVESLGEFRTANPGTLRDVEAGDPRNELRTRHLPNPRRPGDTIPHRGPLDVEGFLRSRGGVQDQGGELRHSGIVGNAPRPDFAGDRRLGGIINPQGMTLDEAGEALAEAGYFTQRPTVSEVVEALQQGRQGRPLYHVDDAEELARFSGAQKQQWDVEAAQQAGAPLADDIGEAAGRERLDSDVPPVTAYEDLPRLGGKVGNINLSRIESAGDIRRLLQNVEARFGGFDEARRGRISHEETRALATELGMTADDLLRRRKGQALNAEQALAARQLLAKSSDEVIELARRATGSEASDESKAAFSQALLRHAAIHEQVTGAVAEAGRALSAMRAAARSRAVSGRIHQVMVEGAGGGDRLEDIATGILELQRQGADPGDVNRFAVNAMKPRFFDKVLELWYNSILSGPATHVVNVVSNTLTSLAQIPEHAAAAAIGASRRAVNRNAAERIAFSEVGARAAGLLGGTREGLRAFAHAIRTEQPLDPVTRLETQKQNAISGLKGQVVRIPGRFLTAEDELFKAIARRMEIHGQAVRVARAEGLRGDAARQRAAELAANPTEAMLGRAFDYARYTTFQRPLGRIAQPIVAVTTAAPVLKFVVPFIRTPTNLFKYAIERSPAAPILREVRDELRAGGASRDLAVARIATGTGMAALVAQFAAEGLITGAGPTDRSAKDVLRADGWQPYSIRIGDTYYSYQRLDPFATMFGVAADFFSASEYMTERQREDVAAMLTASMVQQIHSKTWLSGLSDLILALEDPNRYGKAWISRLAGSAAVPTAVAHVAGAVDPVLREARGPIDRVLSRVPGVSRSLPARRNIWGEEIRRGGGLGPDVLSPIWTSDRRNDPLNREALAMGARLSPPSRRVAGRELSPAKYSRYQELAGRYLRDDFQQAVSDPQWRTLDVEERRERFEKIKRIARADARADLNLEAPPLPPGFELAN